MLYVAEHLMFVWLPLALITGFVVGWYSCSADDVSRD
jgi:hypothetical protein